MPFRGDETNLNSWQLVLMLFVGIGGLWFIPTFHNITKLPPFLGALCVLSVLWVVNEAFNRKLMQADRLSDRRLPQALQYGAIQQMLFVMGIMLGMGVVMETGVFSDVSAWIDYHIHNGTVERHEAFGLDIQVIQALGGLPELTLLIVLTHKGFDDTDARHILLDNAVEHVILLEYQRKHL